MDEFDVVWKNLQTSLKPGSEIKNWNPYNGYLGETLTIIRIDLDKISVDPPRVWKTQIIPKYDFEQVWEVWGDYTALRLERSIIRDLTNHSKYIISIFHWHDTGS
ncbi:MAG: hypothetical protein MUO57_03835 [Anaerolineales bacterium]|nr:hypothetical protein [Anaerolineales bacterium]